MRPKEIDCRKKRKKMCSKNNENYFNQNKKQEPLKVECY